MMPQLNSAREHSDIPKISRRVFENYVIDVEKCNLQRTNSFRFTGVERACICCWLDRWGGSPLIDALIQFKQNNTYQAKGLSTRVRICAQIAIRFRARFVRKQNRDPIIFLSPITIVCLHIAAKQIKN
jgi:hypothetical protein